MNKSKTRNGSKAGQGRSNVNEAEENSVTLVRLCWSWLGYHADNNFASWKIYKSMLKYAGKFVQYKMDFCLYEWIYSPFLVCK